jgi:hypothetical protein
MAPSGGIGSGGLSKATGVTGEGCNYYTRENTLCGFNCADGFFSASSDRVKCEQANFKGVGGARCRPLSEDEFWPPPTISSTEADAVARKVKIRLAAPVDTGSKKSSIRKFVTTVTPATSLTCPDALVDGKTVPTEIMCTGLDADETYLIEISTVNAKGAGTATRFEFCTFTNPLCTLKAEYTHGDSAPPIAPLNFLVLASAKKVIKATVSITGNYESADVLKRQPGLPFEGFLFENKGSGVVEVSAAAAAEEGDMNVALRQFIFYSEKPYDGDFPSAALRTITIAIEYDDGVVLTNYAEVSIDVLCLSGVGVQIGMDDPTKANSPIYATISFLNGNDLPADGQVMMVMPKWFDALTDVENPPFVIHSSMSGIDGAFHPLYVGGKRNEWGEPADTYTTQDLILTREGDGSTTSGSTAVAYKVTNLMVSLPELINGAYDLGDFEVYTLAKSNEVICRSGMIRSTAANGVNMVLTTELPTQAPTLAAGATLPPPPAPTTGYDPSGNSDSQNVCDSGYYGPVARTYGSADLPDYFNWYGGSTTRLSWYMPYEGSWQAPGMKGTAACWSGTWGIKEPWKSKTYLNYIGGKRSCCADTNGVIFKERQQSSQRRDQFAALTSERVTTPKYPTCNGITRAYWHTYFYQGYSIQANPCGGYDTSAMVWNGQWYSGYHSWNMFVVCERDGVEGDEYRGESYNGHFYWAVGRQTFASTRMPENKWDGSKWISPTNEDERCQGWYCYMRWGHAQDYCHERGGYLVEPTTAAENKWVREASSRMIARANKWWYCPDWWGGQCYYWWRPMFHLGFNDIGGEDCWNVKTKFTRSGAEGGDDIDLNMKGSCQASNCEKCPDPTKLGVAGYNGVCKAVATSIESVRKFKQQCGITCKLNTNAASTSSPVAEAETTKPCYPEDNDGQPCPPDALSVPTEPTYYLHGDGSVPVFDALTMGGHDDVIINKTVITIVDNYENSADGGDRFVMGPYYPNSFPDPTFDASTAEFTIENDDSENRYAIAIKEVMFITTKRLPTPGIRHCRIEIYYKDGFHVSADFDVVIRGGFTNAEAEVIQNQGPPTVRFKFTSTFPLPADGGISIEFPTRVPNGPVFADIVELRPSMLLDSVEFGEEMIDGRFLDMQLSKGDGLVAGLYGKIAKSKRVELKFNRALNYENSSEPLNGGLRRIGGWKEDWMTGGSESGYFRNFSFSLGPVMKATGLINQDLVKTVPITIYSYDGMGNVIDGPMVLDAVVTKACDYAQCLKGTADGQSCISSKFPKACGEYMVTNEVQSSEGQEMMVSSDGGVTQYNDLSATELQQQFCKGAPDPPIEYPAFYRGDGNSCPAVVGTPETPKPDESENAKCPNGWLTKTTTNGPWDNNADYENWVSNAATMNFDYYAKSGTHYPGQLYDTKQVGDGPEYYLQYYSGGYGQCNGMLSDTNGDGNTQNEPWGFDISYMQSDGAWRPYVSGWLRSGMMTMCEVEAGGWETCDDDFDHVPEAFGIKSYRGWWDYRRGQRSQQFDKKCYVTVSVPNWGWQWFTAREYCDKEWGGHLVTIESAEEQQFVFERMLDFFNYPSTYAHFPGSLFLGFNDFWNEGCWNAFIPSYFNFWLDAGRDGTTASCQVTECVRCNKKQILSDGGTKCIDPVFKINMPPDVTYNVNNPAISLLGAGDNYKLNYNLFTFESRFGSELLERVNVSITNPDQQADGTGDRITWKQDICYSPELDDLVPCRNKARSRGVTVRPFNATTGALVLDGPATVEEFDEVLKTLEFHSTAVLPALPPRIVRVLADRLSPRAEQAAGVFTLTINNAPEIHGYYPGVDNVYTLERHRRGMATPLWPNASVFDPDHHDYNIESLTVRACAFPPPHAPPPLLLVLPSFLVLR